VQRSRRPIFTLADFAVAIFGSITLVGIRRAAVHWMGLHYWASWAVAAPIFFVVFVGAKLIIRRRWRAKHPTSGDAAGWSGGGAAGSG
jgi:hypothetical protein